MCLKKDLKVNVYSSSRQTKKWKQSKFLPTCEWTDQTWYNVMYPYSKNMNY